VTDRRRTGSQDSGLERSAKGEDGVISERTDKRQEALDRTREARRKVLDDPLIQERTREIREAIARGETSIEPGITAEELPDFLSEHNS
jgi:hypothetical protein